MNAMHVAMAGALAMASVAVWCARGEPERGDGRHVSIYVECASECWSRTDDEYGAELFIASSANGWNPRSEPKSTNAFVDEERGCRFLYTFRLPRNVVAAPDFKFKVTRGDWSTVEVDAQGRDTLNRTVTKQQLAATENGEPIRIHVEGWADQRGTRWPAGAPIAKTSTVTGVLVIHDFPSNALWNRRFVRVWLPPGYSDAANAERRYPVLYMHDGQSCFDAATSFAGEWGLDETATKLIEAGTIEPMIIVGIDNTGPARSDEYSPIELGSRRPGTGGKGDAYVQMLIGELMPWINEKYRTKTGPENTALGGSSLGGVITLHAAMTKAGVFGAILVESPSLWVGDGQFKRNVTSHSRWPSRVYLGMGGAEYGKAEDDAALVAGVKEVRDAMASRGLGGDRLMLAIEDGAVHNEGAWARRLPGAMAFLFRRD